MYNFSSVVLPAFQWESSASEVGLLHAVAVQASVFCSGLGKVIKEHIT